LVVLHVTAELEPLRQEGELAKWVRGAVEGGLVLLLSYEGRHSLGGVEVIGGGVPPSVPTSDVVERAFLEAFTTLAEAPYRLDPRRIEAVEGHEWRGALVAYVLARRLGKPFRYSIYTTEEERGGSGLVAEAVRSIEAFLEREADVVIYRLRGSEVRRERGPGRAPAEAGSRLRVMHISWEWPPHMIGGLGRAVHSVARRMAGRAEVYVLTIGLPGCVHDEDHDGLHVLRVDPFALRTTGLVSWVYAFNLLMVVKALERAPRPHIIHVHDWLGAPAGVALKHLLRVPLVATIHATEYGRSRGSIVTPMQRQIHYWEWRLAYEAWRVFVCSEAMREEVREAFSLPPDKTFVLPNGIDVEEFDACAPEPGERARYALPWEKIVLFAGRHVHDKGVDVLLEAARIILSRRSDVKFVVAGDGPLRMPLMERARHYGIWDKVYFTGRLSDEELFRAYKLADVVAIPSRYEPFGIVTLEAMAAAKPVVASRVGGLREIVVDGETGILVPPDDPYALAAAIERLLDNPELAAEMGRRGRQRVEELYRWDKIVNHLLAAYERVREEYAASGWSTLFDPAPPGGR